LRLKSIKNIAKITKSMKMIASTKLAKAQRAMETGRVFGKSINGRSSFYVLFSSYILGVYESIKPITAEHDVPLLVAVSSDRGLCGAIHSSIAKCVRKKVREDFPTAPILVLGDKAKPQVAREARDNIVMHFNQLGRNIPVFADAANIVDTIKAQNISSSSIHLYYNKFKSVIAYENTALFGYSFEKLKSSGINIVI
jgi:F-type H+-transporting ATPase subunit gamma